jgi:hypothetical protein
MLLEHHRLVHGTTLHGKQFRDPDLRRVPISYYHRTGPVGEIFRAYNNDPRRAFGVIGLGTGSMACYGLPGQRVTFYDIDPVVKRISFDTDQYFSFVTDAKALGVDVQLVMGDARLTLARQPLDSEEDKYGLLVVDAFSSDAIPVHLITLEAVEMIFTKMRQDGIVLYHISNRYLDLEPVLGHIAERLGLVGYHFADDDENYPGKNRSHWVALARKKEHLEKVLQPKAPWTESPAELSLLGVVLSPDVGIGCPSSGSMFARGLCYALHRVADAEAVKKEKETGKPAFPSPWEKVKTTAERQADLESVRAEIAALEAKIGGLDEKAAAELKGDLRSLQNREKKLRRGVKVGVWTDDYSNLLRVFDW